ncbi:FAD-dependent oxidoreductase [Oleiharenicola lentus]|uniref:FAD-dependent oxidoreductase n=1 Tax=Oleiharenicola lentus TaxID=2508720 RepID=UPI003F662C82
MINSTPIQHSVVLLPKNANAPRFLRAGLILLLAGFASLANVTLSAANQSAASANNYDVVVFGATPAGIMASVAAAQRGESVILLEPSYIVGGMLSGGLTKTDIGNRATVGGLSLEFFSRVERYYRDKYGPDSEQLKATHRGLFFEPHVADLVFSALLKEAGVTVLRKQQIVSAEVKANRLVSMQTRHYETDEARVFTGKVFIDSTYEGDLMAAAHVPYRVGREAREEYNESLAGLTEGPAMYRGKGDHRVQAYNFRSTLTTRDDIRVPIAKPKYYTPEQHRHFIESVKKHNFHTFEDLFHDAPLWGPVNGKSDPNKADFTGVNYNYPEADYAMRAEIAARVRDHWLSMWWLLQNDPELPEDFKASARRWGLPKDEFVESGHVSPQIYVREARRLLGRHMLTQRDLELSRHKPDTIAQGSYNIDSHDVALFLMPEGLVKDGYLISSVDAYEIPYRSITPFAPNNLLVTCAVSATHIAYGSLRMEPVFMMIGQAAGFAAHLAHRQQQSVQEISISQLQGLLKEAGIPLQSPYRPVVEMVTPAGPLTPGQSVRFSAKDLDARSPLKYYWNFDGSGETQSNERSPEYTFPAAKTVTVSLKAVDEKGNHSLVEQQTLTIGDGGDTDFGVKAMQAELTGRWDRGSTRSVENRRRVNYIDMNAGKGEKRAVFSTVIPRAGRYRVAFAFQDGPERAAAVPVTVTHADGDTKISVNQRQRDTVFVFRPLGDFKFRAGETARVTVSNEGTTGQVSIDEVRWIWLGP